jgi:hypothetical protein
MPFSIVERIKFRALMTQKWWPDNAVISGRLSTAGRPPAVEANPCKFRLLAGNRGLRAVGNLMPGSPLSNRVNLS